MLDLPLNTALSYQIPEKFRRQVGIGQRVLVPLRDRRAVGCIVGLRARTPVKGVRPVERVIDERPILQDDLLTLSRWVATTYFAGWGEALCAMLPGPLRRGKTSMTPRTPWVPASVTPTTPLTLTAQQGAAAAAILDAVNHERHEVFVLHGVTSSGKTEVYLRIIQRLLELGRQSIILVPEIALTLQTIERFTARFGPQRVSVLHSGMRESHRFQEWQRVAQGKAEVVIGARSAVFAPVPRLGLIVVDEEHESTYKQADTPRYHARETAVERARIAGAVVILGSATPSLESYYRTQRSTYTLLTLTERIDRQPMPVVEIVDLKRQPGKGRPKVLSLQLESAIEKTLAEHQQTILFLNRRGYATFIQCQACGLILRCPSCQISLTHHQAKGCVLCHYCRYQAPTPTTCPSCQGPCIRFRGTGTQRVESEVARAFPTARIARMDSDAMTTSATVDAVLSLFRRREIDILVGTQMVAKGHDFPQVTLIGVINADVALHLPDFRSSERTFGLLTQVAGRAGRGPLPGRVIVQTALAKHSAIVHASRHDYETFYREELALRQALHLPPVTAMAQLTIESRTEERARSAAVELAQFLAQTKRPAATILGPAPSHAYRLRKQFRWQIIVCAKTLDALITRLAPVRGQRHFRGAHLIVDIDPWNPW